MVRIAKMLPKKWLPKKWLVVGLAACAVVVVLFQLPTQWLQLGPDDYYAFYEEELPVAAAQPLQELAREMAFSPAALGVATAAAAAKPAPPPPTRAVYVITATYQRPEQLAELTRLSQTLMHVPALRWLVIEDAFCVSPLVAALLARSGIPHEHLVAPMPAKFKSKWRMGPKPKGVSNRRRGLKWLRANATAGVLYFADDDNTYDIRLFEEIRSTRRVAMWPVGLLKDYGVSTPVVEDGKLKGFYGWIGGRKFPTDMAGFAVSVEFLRQRPKANMPYAVCHEEDLFLRSLAPFEPDEIELKANNCTEILVWHTRTVKNEPAVAIDMQQYGNTNLVHLKNIIV